MPQQLKEGLIGKKIMDQERRWEENELSHEIWVCVPVEMGWEKRKNILCYIWTILLESDRNSKKENVGK